MIAPDVVVLDYGSGNLRSAERALARVGARATVTSDADRAREAEALVVPGVGAYAACMAGIRAIGADQIIGERIDKERPVLGICVGMQVLFDYGDEHGLRTRGISVFEGGIERIMARRIPHMGWNSVDAPSSSNLFRGLGDARFYFVHSYAAKQVPSNALGTWTEHDERFLAAVESGIVSGTQFHPEKSGDAGAQLLSNWLETLR